MNPILHKIVQRKREEHEERKSLPLPKRENPLYPWESQLKQKNTTIIAECKKGSPSAGILIKDYNPIEIATTYQESGAKAISVLTDTDFFFGSLADLQAVSRAVSLPTIRKDFILYPRQIEEAYAYGASAILLIVRILDDLTLGTLIQIAKDMGMGVLVETHTQEEIQRALAAGANTIGINTRDLDTFQIHKHLVEDLAPKLDPNLVRVAESGIHAFEDWQSFRPYVDSLLVGTYFMKSPNIKEAFHKLLSAESKI